MSDLTLSEAKILHDLISDPYGDSALKVFFNKQRQYHLNRAKDFLLSGDVDGAIKESHMVLTYDEALPQFKEFVRRNLNEAAA